MANSNKSSFAKVGFTVLVGVAVITAAFIYIGGLRGNGPITYIETYYDKGVSGLAVGSTVNLRGVKIGEVKEISFVGCKYDVDEINSARIYIKMAINHRLLGYEGSDAVTDEEMQETLEGLVQKGLRATVTSSGITGLSRMEVDFYPPEKASQIEKLSWRPRYVFIPPQMSLLDSFSDSATKVMNQINRIDLNAISSNIAISVDSIAKATESLKVMMEVRQGDIDKICDDLIETANSLKEASQELKQNPSLLIRERRARALPETER